MYLSDFWQFRVKKQNGSTYYGTVATIQYIAQVKCLLGRVHTRSVQLLAAKYSRDDVSMVMVPAVVPFNPSFYRLKKIQPSITAYHI